MNDETELAPSETDTGSIYAWALDYDDPDEFPTQPILTPRRITALSVTVSLVLIAVCGAVAFIVYGGPAPGSVIVAAPSTTPTTVTVTTTPPPSVTVTAAAPAPSRAPFVGIWSMHGLQVSLNADGSAIYKPYLGTPLGSTWAATWQPLGPTQAMVTLTALTETHGGPEQRAGYTTQGLQWIYAKTGQSLAFTLHGDGYATIQNGSGEMVTLCPAEADYHGTGTYFHDVQGVCGA